MATLPVRDDRGGMDTHRLGRRFEAPAERHLVAAGWTVVDRNVRHRRKEVDLVVRKGRVVAFVEVKGRRGTFAGDPLDAITPAKRRGIESVARWWVARHGRPGDAYRFDAVAVRVGPGGRSMLEHVVEAWRPGDG